ncbi:MAG: rhodanese-like domain-containing protein [Thermodesulfobacteriota bacterium]
MKRLGKLTALALALTLALAGLALAAEEKSAAQAAGSFEMFPELVDAALVKSLVDHKTIGLLVDSRPKPTKYDQGHIPGAISLPFSAWEKMKGLLPADKAALVVFYCEGLTCPLSHKSAFLAQKMGYSNVKVYAEGWPEWKEKFGAGVAAAPKASAGGPAKGLKAGKQEGSLDQAAFQEIIKTKPDTIHLVDVRDPNEFAAGHIKGSVNQTVDQVEKNIASLPKDKPVVFVCGTGARSGEAYYLVKDKRPELTEVYYIDGEIAFDKDGGFKLSPAK